MFIFLDSWLRNRARNTGTITVLAIKLTDQDP